MSVPSFIESVGNRLSLMMSDGKRVWFDEVGNGRFVSNVGDIAPVTPTAPDNNIGVGITASMITESVEAIGGNIGNALQSAQALADGFNNAIAATYPDILNNKNRAACLIGQCAHESGGFRYVSEIGGSSASYAPYFGRGWIQLTWADNYEGFGRWLKALGEIANEDMFVNDPELVANLKWAPYTAIYYFTQRKWDNKNLFQWCDDSSTPWHDISRAVNVGNPWTSVVSNGEAERTLATDAAYAVAPAPTAASTGLRWPVPDDKVVLGAKWGATGSWATYHTGQDFPAANGTPVLAVSNGTVSSSLTMWQAGTNVVITFANGESCSYWHLGSKSVSPGATVTKGQQIGVVGMTGNTFGPHLHFEYYPNGVTPGDIYSSKDPIPWLKAGGADE